jgi:2'-5' RNA ligase
MHITLAFMGQVSEEQLAEVMQAGEQAAAACPPFMVEVTGTGCFPKSGPLRVWFAAIQTSDRLKQLALHLKSSLKDFTDSMPFKPHITLARTRKNANCPPQTAINLSWRVEEIKLFKSTLTNSGAIHEQLKAFRLAK